MSLPLGSVCTRSSSCASGNCEENVCRQLDDLSCPIGIGCPNGLTYLYTTRRCVQTKYFFCQSFNDDICLNSLNCDPENQCAYSQCRPRLNVNQACDGPDVCAEGLACVSGYCREKCMANFPCSIEREATCEFLKENYSIGVCLNSRDNPLEVSIFVIEFESPESVWHRTQAYNRYVDEAYSKSIDASTTQHRRRRATVMLKNTYDEPYKTSYESNTQFTRAPFNRLSNQSWQSNEDDSDFSDNEFDAGWKGVFGSKWLWLALLLCAIVAGVWYIKRRKGRAQDAEAANGQPAAVGNASGPAAAAVPVVIDEAWMQPPKDADLPDYSSSDYGVATPQQVT